MRGERGVTLVELLIAVALTGMLISVVGPSISQIVGVTGYSNGRMLAMHELQNTASWFNLDGQMAVSAVGGSGLALTLPTAQTITYALAGTVLTRNDGINPVKTLAQNISSVSFTVNGRVVTMNLTSTPTGGAGVSEQGIYVVYLRSTP
ncbi:MAG: type II secretion system protein [Dehalococcoidales bacterium]|nr:type II secretion system protein [Dehalococcoidales bacterium]